MGRIFTADYNNGDDVITGSGEEDLEFYTLAHIYRDHFWQPDSPEKGSYNDGLNVFGLNTLGSFRVSLGEWEEKIIPYYVGEYENKFYNVDQDKAYYYLGKVAHLIDDASQPSHIHLDCHLGIELPNSPSLIGRLCDQSNGDQGSDDSFLEEYTANNFLDLQSSYYWQGENFEGEEYDYNNLIDGFDWNEVEPDDLSEDQLNLFKLFWYTAQKTQYWASDDVNGNNYYVDLENNQQEFSPSLWQGIDVISDKEDFVEEDETDEGDKRN